MGSNIRLATAADAPQWLDLVNATLGDQYPAQELYDLTWIAAQFDPASGQETWVVDVDGRINGSLSFLKPNGATPGPIANLGRNLIRPEALADGSAEALVRSVNELISQRSQMAVVRVSAMDNGQQALFENLGYVCVGFQPLKHMLHQRVGILFYVRGASSILVTRTALSESLPQVAELASAALQKMQITNPLVVRDGASGYPLQTDLKMHDATFDDFELWRAQAQVANPPIEVSGRFNLGFGHMRMPANHPFQAVLGQKDQKMTAGVAYYFDEHDRCARITEAFCSDEESMGAMFAHVVKLAQETLGAVYTEVDILATAPRLLKNAEQLGFVPVAYLPAFFCHNGNYGDVIKMVKLNLPYSLDGGEFTAHARTIVQVIDRNFEDQKLGLAIINLLRPLSMFAGLGDGELRKISRLFTQKLYRPGDQVFAKGDASDEAYIVLRGKINIQLERGGVPIATLSDGKIFGEIAFLDGSPRGAFAGATQASILLVVHRSAFSDLVRREPNLGMVVMRNLAVDLAAKLRNANDSLAAATKKRG